MKQYPGYTVVRCEDCPEQHGTLTVLTHDVSGATILLVENEDVNKAFGIGFGTFPSDDTGVFHILEHSVLAGSEKYPVTSPFLQLLKSSMASFLNAMTFPDKTVYPFATPNETDFRNLMDVYLNAVFCPLAMVDRAVFEQEGWHRDADGTVSGVVYNEMQGALASPDAQLQDALERAMFPDTAYGFVSGGDPASIPALTYEKYQRVYRRHYSADNCCVTLYGRMDMAEKLAFLDEHYLSRMPKGTSQPRLTLQDEQPGVCVNIPYYTEKPEADQVQCALAWYTGAFADRERQLGVEILLDALLGSNQSPLKAALLEQQLGADIDIGFDDSTLQPTLELVLRGATEETAGRFAAGVRSAVDDILAEGIPEDLLLASLNAAEFASLERPGSLPTVCWTPSMQRPAGSTPGTRPAAPHGPALRRCGRRWPPAGSTTCCGSCSRCAGAGHSGADPAQGGRTRCSPGPYRRQAGTGPSADGGRPGRGQPQRRGRCGQRGRCGAAAPSLQRQFVSEHLL